ncbi:MAG: hypothetical protein MUE40_15825 [Anaerolineae bacterium]|jgi:L-aminopeptidase/D-esterase-like protein|nr:hypothetical protein [Anaerolineae bacterium]
MNDPRVSDLTVTQLQKIIRETVQEAVAEVMIEFSIAAEMDQHLAYEAEMSDYLRHSLQQSGAILPDLPGSHRADD